MARSAADGVHIITSDQCMVGLTTQGSHKNDVCMAKKRTKFMTNSYHIAKELERTCDGAHKHQALVGGRAKAAERYPPALCRAICRGLIKHTQHHENGIHAVAVIQSNSSAHKLLDPGQFHEDMDHELRKVAEWDRGGAWGDVTGMPLDRRGSEGTSGRN